MDHNNNINTIQSQIESEFNKREIAPHLHSLILKQYYGKSITKIEYILQREADKINMIDMEDFTSSFDRLFNQKQLFQRQVFLKIETNFILTLVNYNQFLFDRKKTELEPNF